MTSINFRLTEEAARQLANLLTLYENPTAVGLAALAQLHGRHFPASVWGFIKFGRTGDIDLYRPELGDDPDRAAKCPDCEQPLTAGNVYVAVSSDGTLSLLCGACVADFNG